MYVRIKNKFINLIHNKVILQPSRDETISLIFFITCARFINTLQVSGSQ